MSVYSGKSSDSTLWGALRRRVTRKGRRSEKQERESGIDRNSGTSDRSFENLGYERHELQSGSEIYLATLDEDLFFEYDEPKPNIVDNKFANEAKGIIESEVYGDSFINSPCFAASPQVVTTSSTDMFKPEVPKDTDSKEHFRQNSDLSEDGSETKECGQTEVERLPAAPLRTESEPIEVFDELSETTEDQIGDTTEEQIDTKDSDGQDSGPLLYSRRFPELMSPVEILALPQEIEFSTSPNPPEIILLPEATSFDGIRSPNKVEPSFSDHSISASTSDTEYNGKTSSGYDVMSNSADIREQVTATSTTIENILVKYADFAGYDFLPEVTNPVRREPRHNEYTVSSARESVEMEDEVFGVMMLTVPELASDAFELIDSSTPRFEESVEDDTFTVTDSKWFCFDEDSQNTHTQIETDASSELSVEDDSATVGSVSEEIIRSEPVHEYREYVHSSEHMNESSYVPDIKPRLSFSFGNGTGLQNFY